MGQTVASMKRWFGPMDAESFRAQLMRGGAGALAVRVLSLLASVASSAVLARVLGAADYGVYAFVFAVLTTLALPVQLGLPTLIVRETARAAALEDWARLRGIWSWATRAVLLGSALMVALVLGGLAIGSSQIEPSRAHAFLWGLPLVPLLALGRARAAALRGLRRVFLGQFPDQALRPALLAALVGLSQVFIGSASAGDALALHSLAAFISFVLGAYLLLKATPDSVRQTRERTVDHPGWLRAVIPLSLISALQVISQNTDLMMLGFMRTDAEVGLYKAAVTAASPAMFGLTVFNIVLQPYIAQMHAKQDNARLQQMVSVGALAGMVVTAPVVLALIFAGRPILMIAFGAEYGDAHLSLAILAVSQGVNAFFGSVGNLLTMSGNERDSVRGLCFSALANVALNAILIPRWGIDGAAIGTGASIVMWNVLFWLSARSRLGIDSTPVYIVAKAMRRRG